MDDLLSAALAYVARGWWIFPVRGKVPALDLVPKWSRDSSNDPAQIVAWFAGSQGLGVAVDLNRSGLCVVDGDNLSLLHFVASLDGWRFRGNRERMSWLYSVNGHPIPQARHPWGEVKSAGGYVVLPPSPHESGVRYEWLEAPEGASGPPLLPFDVESQIAPIEPPRGAQAPWNGITGDAEQMRQADGKAEAQAERVATAVRGERNATLNRAALILGHYCPHYLDPAIVGKLLLRAASESGLTRDDGPSACLATIRSGLARGMAEPEQLPGLPTLLDIGDDEITSIEDAVFDYSDTLRLIRAAARARLVSPWAVLGSALAVILAELPPHYCLPPLVGGVASLNFAVALTGPSGTAKSTAYKVARELLGLNSLRAQRIGPGSGEGLLQTYLEIRPADKAHGIAAALVLKPEGKRQAILYADEVGQIGALGKRLGSTHAPLLRSALTGEALTTTNADIMRNRAVPEGAYRLAMIVGVQPSLAGVLLDDEEAGGPQRFLWLPSQDAHIPDTAPEWPGAYITWTVPGDMARRDIFGRILFGMPDFVRGMAQEALRARHRSGMESTDAQSHALLTQEKAAAGIAALHGRLDVTAGDWRVSDHLMRLSGNVQGRCRDIAGAQARKSLEGRVMAQRQATSRAAGEEAAHDARSVFKVVDRHAGGGAPDRHRGEYAGCPANCIKQGVARLRGQAERLAVAVEYATGADWLEADESGRVRPSGRSRPDGD